MSPSRCNSLVANATPTSGVKCDCPCRHTASGEMLNRSAMALLERPVAIARSICGRAGCLQIVQRNPTARFGTSLDSPKLPPECAPARINRPWGGDSGRRPGNRTDHMIPPACGLAEGAHWNRHSHCASNYL